METTDRSRLRTRLGEGLVIPAHPLALTAERRLDERRQAALTRYYADAGAGGIAVGVHSTQFAIRSAGLFEPVLELDLSPGQPEEIDRVLASYPRLNDDAFVRENLDRWLSA